MGRDIKQNESGTERQVPLSSLVRGSYRVDLTEAETRVVVARAGKWARGEWQKMVREYSGQVTRTRSLTDSNQPNISK